MVIEYSSQTLLISHTSSNTVVMIHVNTLAAKRAEVRQESPSPSDSLIDRL